MTISTTTTLNRYTGNGSTVVFPFTYRILNATDLVVTKLLSGTLVPLTLAYPADYSVSGVGNATGGSITLTVTPGTGDLIVIERVMPITQSTSIRNNSSYFAETHENVFDRGTMVDQQQATALARTFSLPKTIDPATFSMSLPVPVSGQVLAWTPTGLTNATVTNPNVVLPGQGRTTTTLTQYLANNYITNPIDYDADPTGASDSTSAILASLTAKNADTSGLTIFFPTGVYLVTGGGIVLPNPNSFLLSGGGSGSFNTLLRLASGTSPVLTFGDGTHEPFSATIRDLTIDANGLAANPALYFRRVNIFDIYNIRVKAFGAGTGLKNDPTLMFQEMYFRRLDLLGDGTASGICVDIAPTGNVNFDQSNLENALTALRIRGQIYSPVTYNGGHIERAIWAIDADDTQLVLYGTTISQGQIWLGPGAHAGTIVASNHDSSIIEGGISDLGFGNKITVAGGVRTDGKAQLHPALNTDGQEWLRTPNVVDDPLFTLGTASWSATNATITDSKAGMPGGKRGRSLMVQGTLANGYASKTFAAEASTDYLLTIAFIVTPTNAANARVQVLDESSTSLYDSGTLTYTAPSGSGMKVRILRKRIPTSAGTGKQLTVRIYSVGTTVPTIVPLLLLSKSSVNMATQITTSGTGETTSGSGTTLAISQTVNTGTFFTFNSGIKHRGPCFAYFNVTACPVGVYCGHGGDSNGAATGVNYNIDTTPREYCLVFPSFPDSGIIKFYSFAGTGTLTVSDIAVVPIFPPTEPPPLRLVDAATVNLTLSEAREYLLDANGSRTFGAVPAGFDGKTFILTINNITAGAITTTFPASYKLAGGAWTDPATLKRRSITFRIEGTTAYELHRSSGDV